MAKQTDPALTRKKHWVFRHVVLPILVAVIVLISFLVVCASYYRETRKNVLTSLEYELEEAEQGCDFYSTATDLIESYDRDDILWYLKVYKRFLEEDSLSVEDALKEMNEDRENDIYYFLDLKGNWHTIAGDTAPDLSEDFLIRLKLTGTATLGEDTYLSVKTTDGWLIAFIAYAYDITPTENVLKSCGEYVIYADANSLVVQYASEMKMISGYALPELEADPDLSGEYETGVLKPHTGNFLSNLFYRSLYRTTVIDEDYLLITYYPIRKIIQESVYRSSSPFILLAMFSFISYQSAKKLRRIMHPEAGKQLKKLYGNTYLHIPSVKMLSAVLTLAILVETGFTWYILVIQGRSLFNSDGARVLLECDEKIEETYAERDELTNDIRNAALLVAENVASCLDYLPDMKDDPELKELSALFPNIQIDLFDSAGKITHSTANNVGYSLTIYTDDAEYCCWKLLAGEDPSVIYMSNSDDSYFNVAVRRTDEIGFVRIRVSTARIRSMMQLLSARNIIFNQYYEGTMYYADLASPDVLYRIDGDTGAVTEISNVFTDEEMTDRFAGVKTVERTSCCFISMRCDTTNMAFINVIPVSKLMEGKGLLLVHCVVCYILLSLTLVFSFSVYSGEEFQESEEYRNLNRRSLFRTILRLRENEKNIAERSRLLLSMLRSILLLSAGTLVVIFLLNYWFSSWSVLDTIFRGDWSRGLNLFSFTVILLLVMVTIAFCAVIRLITNQMVHYIDPRAATAVKLTSSLLQVLAAVWVFFMGLYEIGVDLSTIVAGLGITTLALSVGAKDSINDLIAGIFIVLDGHVRVGDVVTVNGFYGTVVDMNIRTTKVQYYNEIISVNNSSMVNVVNESGTTSVAFITFSVEYGTDIDLVERMINEQADRINAYIDYKLVGKPRFLDVQELGDYAVVCAAAFPVLEMDRKAVTRKLNRLILTLCDEYGIVLALPTYIIEKGGQAGEK